MTTGTYYAPKVHARKAPAAPGFSYTRCGGMFESERTVGVAAFRSMWKRQADAKPLEARAYPCKHCARKMGLEPRGKVER